MFEYLKDILFLKQNKWVNCTDEQSDFNPFILQRWTSMCSSNVVHIINETTNKWFKYLYNKNIIYKILLTVIPQTKFKKVDYIKKENKSILIENNKIPVFLSSREINIYNKLINDFKL